VVDVELDWEVELLAETLELALSGPETQKYAGQPPLVVEERLNPAEHDGMLPSQILLLEVRALVLPPEPLAADLPDPDVVDAPPGFCALHPATAHKKSAVAAAAERLVFIVASIL
jgi:hypothetical protein